MTDSRELWMDIVRPFSVGKRSVSVDAPTPLQFVIPDPWDPDAAGADPAGPPDGTAPSRASKSAEN
jgi:hypothetical protein